MPVYRPLSERLWEKIDNGVGEPSTCWPFTGATDPGGYGIIWSGRGKTPDAMPAHRAVLEEVVGLLGDSMALHRCNNRICCRPSHLYAGTLQDNADDMVRAGRQARGASHGISKLTDKEVIEIRSDPRPQGVIAEEFGIHQSAVSAVQIGKNWAHLPGARSSIRK